MEEGIPAKRCLPQNDCHSPSDAQLKNSEQRTTLTLSTAIQDPDNGPLWTAKNPLDMTIGNAATAKGNTNREPSIKTPLLLRPNTGSKMSHATSPSEGLVTTSPNLTKENNISIEEVLQSHESAPVDISDRKAAVKADQNSSLDTVSNRAHPTSDDIVSEENILEFNWNNRVRFVLPGTGDIHTYEPVVLEGENSALHASNDVELIETVERNICQIKTITKRLESMTNNYASDNYSMFAPTLEKEGHRKARQLSPRSLGKKIMDFTKRKQTGTQQILSIKSPNFAEKAHPGGATAKGHVLVRHNALADNEESWMTPLDWGLFGKLFKAKKRTNAAAEDRKERNKQRSMKPINQRVPLPQNLMN